jgi:hypothetical protein
MAKKNVTNTMNLANDNGNTAVVEVLKSGNVDVTISNPNNITVIRHFDSLSAMAEELDGMGYKNA